MPKPIEIKVSFTDIEIFRALLEITADAYKRLSDEDKTVIYGRIDDLLGNEFHLSDFK